MDRRCGMERDERRRADALDRYWDAAQRGEQPAPPGQFDELTAAMIARVNVPRARANIDAYHRSVCLRVLEPAVSREEAVQSIARPAARFPAAQAEPATWRS